MKVEIASSVLSRLRGLLGRKECPDLLLLTPCNDVHTFGMNRAIDVAFIAADGLVLESHREVGACRRLRCRPATAALERIAAEAPWFEQGDRIELKELVRGPVELKRGRLL